MKSFTLYFYSQNHSCILYFGIDGKSKKRALKMGKEMAKLLLDYHKADSLHWITKITVEIELYNPPLK